MSAKHPMKGLVSPIRRFWTRSIRRQLMLGIALVHAVMMTIFVFDLVSRQRSFLNEQSRADALSLAEALAASSTSWVLADDLVGLEEVVNSQSGHAGLRYTMVLDLDGRLLGHSDRSLSGRYLVDPVSLSLLSSKPSAVILVDSETILDVAAPIRSSGRLVGWARVAVDRTAIRDGLALVTRDGIIYTVVAVAIGLLFALFMSAGLTDGLRRVVAVLEATRGGRRDLRVSSQREDEVGVIGRAFDGMLDAVIASENALRSSEERFDLAMRGANDGLWDWDLITGHVYFSPRWKEMLGWLEEEVGSDFDEFARRVSPEDLQMVYEEVKAYLDGTIPKFEREIRMRHRDDSWRWILTRGVAVRDGDGCACRMVGTHVDITELKRAQQALFEEKERAQVTLASIADAVISTDEQGRVDYLNPVAERLTGWCSAEARGRRLGEVMQLLDENGFPVESPVERCIASDHVVSLAHDAVLVNRFGKDVAVEDSAAPIHDAQGRLVGAVAVFRDVTQNRRLARELSFQATHDTLTGLLNRREFERRLEAAVRSAQAEHVVHSLAYIDLDQFKVVNDTCGHAAGDELLRQLTPLIGQRVRSHDTLSRLGGDEFGLLLEYCPLREAEQVTQKVLDAINHYRFTWEEKVFSVGASIGLVAITEVTRTSPDALMAADAACYTAKEEGRNRIFVQRHQDTTLQEVRGQMELVARIQAALEEDRFVLYYQAIEPVARRSTGELHYEILVRLGGEDDPLLPGAFIPAAERYNLMGAVDKWVVGHFLQWLSLHPRLQEEAVWCLNLSGSSLGSEEFVEYIVEQLERFHVPPQRICFELTETAAVSNLAAAGRFIRQLRQHGCRFALDDFGSGMSSFAYLKNLPVDYLKIDGHFVRDLAHDPVDHAMVEAINDIGHTVGLETIAEFVESEAILEALQRMGVDYAQGYAVGRPMPIASLLERRCEESA